jgi:hypothetical protein
MPTTRCPSRSTIRSKKSTEKIEKKNIENKLNLSRLIAIGSSASELKVFGKLKSYSVIQRENCLKCFIKVNDSAGLTFCSNKHLHISNL